MPQPPFELTTPDTVVLVAAMAFATWRMMSIGPRCLLDSRGVPSLRQHMIAASAIFLTMFSACLTVTAIHMA